MLLPNKEISSSCNSIGTFMGRDMHVEEERGNDKVEAMAVSMLVYLGISSFCNKQTCHFGQVCTP